jgi:hypothetical protein
VAAKKKDEKKYVPLVPEKERRSPMSRQRGTDMIPHGPDNKVASRADIEAFQKFKKTPAGKAYVEKVKEYGEARATGNKEKLSKLDNPTTRGKYPIMSKEEIEFHNKLSRGPRNSSFSENSIDIKRSAAGREKARPRDLNRPDWVARNAKQNAMSSKLSKYPPTGDPFPIADTPGKWGMKKIHADRLYKQAVEKKLVTPKPRPPLAGAVGGAVAGIAISGADEARRSANSNPNRGRLEKGAPKAHGGPAPKGASAHQPKEDRRSLDDMARDRANTKAAQERRSSMSKPSAPASTTASTAHMKRLEHEKPYKAKEFKEYKEYKRKERK